jgi:hypothetical protein
MRAIIIDPKLQRIVDIELAGPTETEQLADMRRIIATSTLGHTRISDAGDSIWCDDTVLSRGEPCFAFKLGPRDFRVVFGGVCIIVGADRYGNSRPPQVPIEVIMNDTEWLGQIVPEVTWVESTLTIGGKSAVNFTAVVTYSRPK